MPAQSLIRSLNLAPDRLRDVLCKREQRYVGAQLTFSYERQRIMLEENEVTRGLVGRYVETYAFATSPSRPRSTRRDPSDYPIKLCDGDLEFCENA